ncbi:uncharacterized [Tachysurus ichikawai]
MRVNDKALIISRVESRTHECPGEQMAASGEIRGAAQVRALCSTRRQISAAQRRSRTWTSHAHAVMLLLAA